MQSKYYKQYKTLTRLIKTKPQKQKKSQECRTALTSQYSTNFLSVFDISLFLSFVILSFCQDITLIKCLKDLKSQSATHSAMVGIELAWQLKTRK